MTALFALHELLETGIHLHRTAGYCTVTECIDMQYTLCINSVYCILVILNSNYNCDDTVASGANWNRTLCTPVTWFNGAGNLVTFFCWFETCQVSTFEPLLRDVTWRHELSSYCTSDAGWYRFIIDWNGWHIFHSFFNQLNTYVCICICTRHRFFQLCLLDLAVAHAVTPWQSVAVVRLRVRQLHGADRAPGTAVAALPMLVPWDSMLTGYTGQSRSILLINIYIYRAYIRCSNKLPICFYIILDDGGLILAKGGLCPARQSWVPSSGLWAQHPGQVSDRFGAKNLARPVERLLFWL